MSIRLKCVQTPSPTFPYMCFTLFPYSAPRILMGKRICLLLSTYTRGLCTHRLSISLVNRRLFSPVLSGKVESTYLVEQQLADLPSPLYIDHIFVNISYNVCMCVESVYSIAYVLFISSFVHCVRVEIHNRPDRRKQRSVIYCFTEKSPNVMCPCEGNEPTSVCSTGITS